MRESWKLCWRTSARTRGGFDPAVQLLSAVHRALLWYSPLSWFLHRRIVRVAEEASDDAAISATCDRPSYAEILLEFLRPPVGVPMARYENPGRRIQRILDGTTLSRGLTRWTAAAILTLGVPLTYLAAAAQPQRSTRGPQASVQPAQFQVVAAPVPTPPANSSYISAAGNVTPTATVTVRPRIDGELQSVDFREGGPVQAGQLLATIDPRPYEPAVAAAKDQIQQDEAKLRQAQINLKRDEQLAEAKIIPLGEVTAQSTALAESEIQLKRDQAKLEEAGRQLSYTKVLSPIGGVAGLRQVDPGNVIHTSDSIVTITQLEPIAVVFAIPGDALGEVAARARSGAEIRVEVWSRDNSRKLATGHLAAIDNQIDLETGMAKLKAVFDNKDGALMNGAFVKVRLFR